MDVEVLTSGPCPVVKADPRIERPRADMVRLWVYEVRERCHGAPREPELFGLKQEFEFSFPDAGTVSVEVIARNWLGDTVHITRTFDLP